MASTTELLTAVDASILQILGGAQSYSTRGRAARKAELDTLWAMRKELKALERNETGGSRPSVGMQVPAR